MARIVWAAPHRASRRCAADRRTGRRTRDRPSSPARTSRPPGLLRTLWIHRNYAHDVNISYGGHGKKNLLDIWRHPDLERGGRAPVLLQVPGGAWTTGNKRGQAHPLDGPSRRARLGVRVDQLSTQSAVHLARPRHRCQAGDRLGEGPHRRVRWRSGLHRHHRRIGRWSPLLTRGPDRERPDVQPDSRYRHPRAGRRAVLRRLRLHPGRRAASGNDAVRGTQCVEADLGRLPRLLPGRVADLLRHRGRSAVLRPARPQRLLHPGRAGTPLRRAPARGQQPARGVRRTARGPTRIRHFARHAPRRPLSPSNSSWPRSTRLQHL